MKSALSREYALEIYNAINRQYIQIVRGAEISV